MERRRIPSSAFGEIRGWLEVRTRWWQSALSVILGGAFYLWLIEVSGGFTPADSGSTLYSSAMLAHGDFSCAFPSSQAGSSLLSGPIYSIVSAITQWVTRAGFSKPFPSSAQFGVNCHNAAAAFYSWQFSPGVTEPLYRVAVVAWLGLTLSAIWVLRATPLRGTRVTWLIPAAFAVIPPLIFVLQEEYHPQDIWALAMTLTATALWLRGGHAWVTGAMLALAVMSQQYAILAVVVFIVISAPRERRRLAAAGLLMVGLVAIPMYAIGGRGGLSAVFIGTGNTVASSGSWMWELHVSSHVGLAISRVGPIVATFLLAAWCRSRRPDLVRDPVVLLGLLATAWSLRLVFEENLFAYYPMATGVTLVLRDIVARRFYRGTILWLGAVLFAFDDIRNNSAPWRTWPHWIWQVTLASSAFVIAIYSLHRSMRDATDLRKTQLPVSVDEGLVGS